MKEGSPDQLGATFTGNGVNFAIQSRAATRVDVCIFDASGENETARLTLPGRTGAIHHGFVEHPDGWREAIAGFLSNEGP